MQSSLHQYVLLTLPLIGKGLLQPYTLQLTFFFSLSVLAGDEDT